MAESIAVGAAARRDSGAGAQGEIRALRRVFARWVGVNVPPGGRLDRRRRPWVREAAQAFREGSQLVRAGPGGDITRRGRPARLVNASRAPLP